MTQNVHNWVNTTLIGLVVILVLVGGNQSAPSKNIGGQSHTNGGYVINEDGTDDDSRIEGDTNANLLYVDAGNDRVGIGTASPSSTFHVSGTTTIDRSFDGFNAGGGIAPASVATGTAITLYTHTGGPAICDAGQSAFYADSTGYSPSLIWQVGTSTSAAASVNLLASTTVATTTDTLIPSSAESLFRLDAGDEITAYAADGSVAPGASTTNLVNWDVEYQVRCWLIGG